MEDLLFNTWTYSIAVLGYVSMVFCIALWRHDNSVMDIAYGPAFFVAAVTTLFVTNTYAVLPVFITCLIGLWSTRLGLRIYYKNKGKPEDARYAAWRHAWLLRGEVYFAVRSFLQINLLQGSIIIVISLPFLVALSFPTLVFWPSLITGAVIFLLGFMTESIADHQLDIFLQGKRGGTESARIMTTGLFRYVRRPNYLGETLIWWGLAIIVLPLPLGLLALLSPVIITYIVTQVTGPMLERLFLEKYPTEYREYMSATNYFIPRLPK